MPYDFNSTTFETTYRDSIYYQIVAGGRYSKYRFFMDYKYSLLLRNKEKHFLPFLGLGVMFYYQYEHYLPRVSNDFQRSLNHFELDFLINCGFIQKLTDNIHLTFQIPINIYSLSLSSKKIQNPTLPEALRTTTTFDNDFLSERYLIMIGISYMISNKK